MSEDIRKYFKSEMVDNFPNATAKSLLTEKLDNLEVVIGYPDWLNDRKFVDSYYGEVS